MTTNTTTSETASLLSAESEDERPATESDTPSDDQAMAEAGARAWAKMQQDVTPFFRQILQPQWLLLLVPVTVLYLYATVWLCRDEWFKFGSPLLFQPFVPLLALGLVWFRRQQVIRRFYELAFLFPEDSPKRRGNAAATVAIAALCCAAMFGAGLMKSPAVVLMALIVATAAVIYGLFGPFLLRTLWQPLVFLVLVIPPPMGFIEKVIYYLRAGTAYLTVLVAHQFDAGAKQQLANFEPMVHLSSGDLIISTALCGASVVAAVFVLTVWWCVAKQIPALQSILLVVVGFITGILLNALRLIALCVLTGVGAFSVSAPNPWLVEISSAVLIALAFAVVVFTARRLLAMMVRKADVPEIEEDDVESDLENILRGERSASPAATDSARPAPNGDANR